MIPSQVRSTPSSPDSLSEPNATPPELAPLLLSAFSSAMDLALSGAPSSKEVSLEIPPAPDSEKSASIEDDSLDKLQDPLALSSACALIHQPLFSPLPLKTTSGEKSCASFKEEGTSMPGQFVPIEEDLRSGGEPPTNEPQLSKEGSKLDPPPTPILQSFLKSESYTNPRTLHKTQPKTQQERLSAPSEPDGTTDAQRPENMRSEAKMNYEICGNKQSLPLMSPVEQASAEEAKLPSVASTLPVFNRATENRPQTGHSVLESELPVAASNLRSVEYVESLSDMILHQTIVLKRLQSDSMDVVLRPDVETELVLQVSQNQGTVHISARCEKGDWESLSACWGDLQQSLQARGIQIGRLETPLPASWSTGQPGFGSSRQNQQQTLPDRNSDKPAFREAPAPSSAISTAKRLRKSNSARVRSGWAERWESWA